MQTPPPRRVLVTGGTGYIGGELVRAFAAAGYAVVFQYNKNAKRAAELQAAHSVDAIKADFLIEWRLNDSEFDILVNCAGINPVVAPIHDYPVAAWDDTLRLNTTVPFQLAKQCLPGMIEKGWGRIINISSLYGLKAEEEYGAYNVSKHGLRGLTRTISREYSRYGITCNEICPGPVDSEMFRRNRSLWAADHGETLEGYMNEITREIPSRQLTQAPEVAALAVFLASDLASGISGTSLPIDGGVLS